MTKTTMMMTTVRFSVPSRHLGWEKQQRRRRRCQKSFTGGTFTNVVVVRRRQPVPPLLLFCWFLFVCLILATITPTVAATKTGGTSKNTVTTKKRSSVILVVGSANADTFLPVARLPTEGENLTLLPNKQPKIDIPGGKGCTQAVAVSKLLQNSNDDNDNDNNMDVIHRRACKFVGQFGNDPAGHILKDALEKSGVDISSCTSHKDLSSGRGYVFLTQSGSVSAVVSGGSNVDGWKSWKAAWEKNCNNDNDDESRTVAKEEKEDEGSYTPMLSKEEIDQLLVDVDCILLQREVPEYVNLLIAKHAHFLKKDTTTSSNKNNKRIIIIQDVGGEDREISSEMLQYCDYIIPNESELQRLVLKSCTSADEGMDFLNNDGYDNDDERIVSMAKALQKIGARNVLVTRGSSGSTLVTENGQSVIHQPAFLLPKGKVIDETGAGDCYRAAFAVSLLEGREPIQKCMQFASAAGSCSVEVNGAVPSTPSRHQVEERLIQETVLTIPRGDGQQKDNEQEEKKIITVPRGGELENDDGIKNNNEKNDDDFPFLIGSRLNSMKDRPELWLQDDDGSLSLNGPKDYVLRQSKVKGLTCIDFNYPQHFGENDWNDIQEVKETLSSVGLVPGAICLRYPNKLFARGAMNHPYEEYRQLAIEMTKNATRVAIELGCNEVVVWSAFDGYDYPFQVNYNDKWDELVVAFRELCDEFPTIKFSLEYKPTDENTRFFTVPSTAAALLLITEIDRPNMGITLDVGHMLMSGENPGQSIAMIGRTKKLFGIQLNDGYTRLAAEDGMMFGSIHPSMALEIMYQLRVCNFDGHIYFDTFPQRTDPVLEAEYNIKQVKKFWRAANFIHSSNDSTGTIENITKEHDAIGALELVNTALRNYL